MGLWKEHFHWSVLLRPDVWLAIITTLLAVAGLLLYFDQYLGANVCFVLSAAFVFAKIAQLVIISADSTVSRLVFTFLLFGLVGIAVVETVRGVNRWASSRRTPEGPAASTNTTERGGVQRALPPLSASSAFSVVVPVETEPQGRPLRRIPFDENFEDPRVRFYRDLGLLSQRPFVNPPGITYEEKPLSDPKIARLFLAELLQYYMLRQIRVLGRGTVEYGITKFLGNPHAVASAIDQSPLRTPDAAPYPLSELFKTLGSKFLNVYSYSTSAKEGIQTPRWQQLERSDWHNEKHPFEVPRGTIIILSGNDEEPKRDVILRRAEFYELKFSVVPVFGAKSALPQDFRTSSPGVDSYSCQITMDYEVQQRNDGGFVPDAYVRWAQGLFGGLKNAMAP